MSRRARSRSVRVSSRAGEGVFSSSDEMEESVAGGVS